ncbi:phage protein [Staphylococcus aureus]|nr:phage protein [Staphylococcus aureus]
MFNTPKMKLPEKHTEVFKTYKNGTPEEKAEIEGCFIKTVKDEDSEFYSPMLASLNEQ